MRPSQKRVSTSLLTLETSTIHQELMFIVKKDKNHKENPHRFDELSVGERLKQQLWRVPPVPAFAAVCGLPGVNTPKAGAGNRCIAVDDWFVRRSTHRRYSPPRTSLTHRGDACFVLLPKPPT